MKLFNLSIIFILLSLNFHAQKKVNSLDLEGTVSADRTTLQGAVVTVHRDGKYFTSFVTANDGEYNLYLPLGSEYLVTVTKKDFIKKIYTVDTRGVPAENLADQFPVIEADVDLFKTQKGIDYSLFDEPMNKYFYNSRKDNFDFDKEYLKSMQAQVAEFRRNEKQLVAEKKAEAEKKKQEQVLAMQKAEREKFDAEALKKLEEEQKVLAARKPVTSNVLEDIVVTPSASSVNEVVLKKNNDQKIAAVLLQYKPGVTEEVLQAKGVIVIKRVVVRDEMAWVYLKKIFSWGGTSFSRDGQPITESIFEQETKSHRN